MSIATYNDIVSNMKFMMKEYMNMGLYTNALFYADKIFYTDKNQSEESLYDLAQCYYYNKEYYRCVNIIQKCLPGINNVKFYILLGQALLACEDYESVITYLDKNEGEIVTNNFLESVKYLIIGKAYELQENKSPAIRSYIKALQLDPGNVEAFEILSNHCLLSSDQKKQLLSELKYDICNNWLHDYFLSKWHDNIYVTDESNCGIETEYVGNIVDMLIHNCDPDLKKMEAEKYFTNRDYTQAYNLLKK